MSHAYHELPRIVLGDDCDECVERSRTLEGLASLDEINLRRLALFSAELKASSDPYDKPAHASHGDMRAVDNLRLAARIVFKSGITEETAR